MTAPIDKELHRGAAIEQIALDAIGALSGAEGAGWVREHLDTGCEICAQAAEIVHGVFESMLLAAQPVKPPASLRERVLRAVGTSEPVAEAAPDPEEVQLWNKWAVTDPKFYTLGSDATEWQEIGLPGIEIRQLHVDEVRDSVTMVVRMAAGTSYPRHKHAGDEHCYVLQGDLRVEDQVLRCGDYQFAPEGSIHGEQSTENGCTLLIVSSRSDELLTD